MVWYILMVLSFFFLTNFLTLCVGDLFFFLCVWGSVVTLLGGRVFNQASLPPVPTAYAAREALEASWEIKETAFNGLETTREVLGQIF